LRAAIRELRPETVFHLAAQSLVRASYREPVETYATNVMGTVHVLEAVRSVPTVRGVVVVTSDKCYENKEWPWAYRETEAMGGHDPYSSSKGCAELVTAAYRRSFFSGPGNRAVGVATARAGNVIGGGDWSTDRLIPDAVGAFRANQTLRIRNPLSIRPWQHVMDPVLGYLGLAERLIGDGKPFAESWNFGPGPSSEVTVGEVADHLTRRWGADASWCRDGAEHPREAAYLRLDCTKANTRLDWNPALSLEQSLDMTVEWYKHFAAGSTMRDITLAQIDRVMQCNP
jgi:CDP-glucose 4,6-dehydratase